MSETVDPADDAAKDAASEAATSASSTLMPQQHATEQHKQRVSDNIADLRLNRITLEQQLQQLQLELAVSAAASTLPNGGGQSESPSPPHQQPSDVVTLNVGGKLFSCHRQTLCLVKESLLDLMFSGRWPDHGTRDVAGNIFLDLDPALFEVVLNWLRRFNMSHGGNIPEPVVPEDKVPHLLAMLDYLQLHRHIPVTYHENFDQQHYSPFMMVHGATARRTAVAAQHKGRHFRPYKSALMQFAVTDTAHPYFDMHVDISLAVVEFQESIECSSKPQYMFIGFVHKAAAAMLVPDGNINSQLTKVPGCYGWLVGGGGTHTVRNGKRSQESCTKDSLLWNQGDQVVLTLDTRRDKNCASISILNTVTGAHKSIDAEPAMGQTSSSDSSNDSGSKTSSRPGMRHRTPRGLLNNPGGVHREEILAILDQQPADVNGQVAELVVGAAMQVLEAQGIDMQAALDVLRQPGLVQRLVQQVRHVQQVVRRQAEAPGNLQQQRQQQHQLRAEPDAAAAGSAPIADRPAGQDQAAGSTAENSVSSQCGIESADQDSAGSTAAGNAQQQQQQPQHPGEMLGSGCILPKSSAEYEWVLVVGMVQPKDSLRLISVKRRGQRPPAV